MRDVVVQAFRQQRDLILVHTKCFHTTSTHSGLKSRGIERGKPVGREASMLFVGKLDDWEQKRAGVQDGPCRIALPLSPAMGMTTRADIAVFAFAQTDDSTDSQSAVADATVPGKHRYGSRGQCGPMRRHHHHVYVVLLSDRVWNEPSFRKANPEYQHLKSCVYVGMTGLDPDTRMDRHKAGVKSNRFVQQYGERLIPELYEVYNPMPYEAAREMEVELAIALRERGYGVWQA